MGRISHEIKSFLLSKKIILGYPELPSRKNCVNLHYHHAELVRGAKSDTANLGDDLAEPIVSFMLAQKGLSLDTTARTAHLYAIGSILLMGYQSATVWGSGLPYEPSTSRSLPHRFRKLDVRAVRGPYTRDTLMRMGFQCPEVYGDPAVLMPLIYTPDGIEKSRDYVCIPHYQKEKSTFRNMPSDHVVSMNTKDYKSVVDAICSAKKVVSSSLHGIILAESYGVPAIFYNDRPERFHYKYQDWYASTGRECRFVSNMEDALTATFPELPELAPMQKALTDSFPYDLWERR